MFKRVNIHRYLLVVYEYEALYVSSIDGWVKDYEVEKAIITD